MCEPYLSDLNESEGSRYKFLSKILTDFYTGEVGSIIKSPPVHPKPGQLYVFKEDEINYNNYTADQLRWVNGGKKVVMGGHLAVRKWFLRDPHSKKKEKVKTLKFRRIIAELKYPPTKDSRFFIIFYSGDEDVIKHYQNSTHLNSKSKNKLFFPTQKSVGIKIKENIENSTEKMSAKKIFEKENIEALKKEDQTHTPVDRPRNPKQCENILYSHNRLSHINQDEIFSVVELTQDLPNFFHLLSLIPSTRLYMATKESLDIAKLELSIYKSDRSHKQILGYDTTYQLGDYYVSPLVMRKTNLDGEPLFPVIFHLHEKKDQLYHKEFFSFVTSSLDINPNDRIPIVTDREKAIVNAIGEHGDKYLNIFCSNHILRDVEYWLKKNCGKASDIKVYKDHTERLLNSESIDQYNSLYKSLSLLWSQDFMAYYDNHLHSDIITHAAKFITSEISAFETVTTTNNVSESFNRVLKDSLKKDSRMDDMGLQLYKIQKNYEYNFYLAERGMGPNTLKEEHKLKKTEDTDMFCRKNIEEIYKLIHQENMLAKREKFDPQRRGPKFIAEDCVKMNGVTFENVSGAFIVKNPYNKQIHAVTMSPESCTCKSSGRCWHISAVEKSQEADVQEKRREYTLSALKRKRRGKYGKHGHKKVRQQNYDYDVIPAPDAAAWNDVTVEKNLLIRSDEGKCILIFLANF